MKAGKATGVGGSESWSTLLKAKKEGNISIDSPYEGGPPRSRLQGTTLFKDIRSNAENFIYKNLNKRVDEFCSLAAYHGVVGGPGDKQISFERTDVPNSPSDYIMDMMSFLQSTFVAFTHLPPKVAHTACISVCKHVCQTLQDIILSDEVKMVTENCLRQVSLDLSECESFAKSDTVTGIDKSTLMLIFQDLRQLLTLVKKDDWPTYFQTYGLTNGNPYDRVTPKMCLNLLERLRDGEKRKTGFMQQVMNKEEREKKKRFDEIIKQLKDLRSTGFRRT